MISTIIVSVDSCAEANSDSATAAAEYMIFFMKIGLLKPRQGAITCSYTNIARSLAALPAQVLWVCSQPVGPKTFWAPL